MQLWKLGCRWGSGTPLFYDFIKENNVLIGWVDKDYLLGSFVLVTDGHTVLDIAEVKSIRKSVLDFPKYESKFRELEIEYDENIFIYEAFFYNILDEDRFIYPLQQGIVRVQSQEYINMFQLLKTKYIKSEAMKNHIELLRYKKQIILQGPPGTGKTREGKFIAKEMLGLKEVDELIDHEQFKLIQFHPSYTYDDFVRGIVATPNQDGEGIVYEAENKILGAFAKQALDNYLASKQTVISNTNDVSEFESFIEHVKDEIAQSELHKYDITEAVYLFDADEKRFKYKGDNWKAHAKGLNMKFSELRKIIDSGAKERQDIKKMSELEELTRQHATYFIKIVEKYYDYKGNHKHVQKTEQSVQLKNYVLIIDEINRANLSSILGELIYALEYRGESVESMYAIDGDNKLILPPNLYIIGTMNTADRSVGHIDYAIRRRFAFVDVLPKDLSNEEGITFDQTLFNQVAELFDRNLSPEFKKKDVQLGHSYFIDKSKQEDGVSISMRLEYEIRPILFEYVKDGVLIGENIESQIENLVASI